jgi:hypothetical protein
MSSYMVSNCSLLIANYSLLIVHCSFLIFMYKEFVMKKTVYGFITVIAAFVLGAGFFACENPSGAGGGGVSEGGQQQQVVYKVGTPVAVPAGGSAEVPEAVGNNTMVALATVTKGAVEIYYTLDGSVPDSTKTRYSADAPIAIAGAHGDVVMLRVVAVKAERMDSDVLTAVYGIDTGKVATPWADPAPGSAVPLGGKVFLDTGTAGASIYYSYGGTPPSAVSNPYTADGISLVEAATINAIAVMEGMAASGVLSASYTIQAAGGGGSSGGDDDDYNSEQDEGYVPIAMNSVTVSPDTLQLAVDATGNLTATTDPAGVKVVWSSSAPDVASVDQNGAVTGKTGGQAVIKAKAGGKEDTATVTVAALAGVYVGQGTANVYDDQEPMTLAKALAWISTNGPVDGGEYVIVLGESETDNTANGYVIGAGTNSSTGTNNLNMKVTLKGSAENIVIEKTAQGPLLTVLGKNSSDTPGPELVLENITLKGYNSNNKSVVVVGGNNASNYKGKLTMENGAVIRDNTNSGIGGSVYVQLGGTFVMNGGTIAYNKSTSTNLTNGMGAGVYCVAVFQMHGGFIQHNEASKTAGGVGLGVNASFTMTNGVIKGNRAGAAGGAAVHRSNSGTGSFEKTGGTIYGNGTVVGDESIGNDANKAADNAPDGTYNAIKDYTRTRDKTAGPEVTLVHSNNTNWGE